MSCFATVIETGERLQFAIVEGLLGICLNSNSDIPNLPVFPFYHFNRCFSEDELSDIVYEDDPRYIADIEAKVYESRRSK